MKQNKNFILIFYGPTGVGKSDFAERLGAFLPIEIINMDVGQFYTPLSIGTAKPAWQQSPISHRLFDIISEPRNLTVAEYRDLIMGEIQHVWNRGNIPALVGGSGFYLLSLFYPPTPCGVGPRPSIQFFASQKITQDERAHAEARTWQDLHELDPDRAREINPQDTYRIQRALDIIHATGLRSSLFKPHFDPISPFVIVDCTRDREDLYQRINQRTEQMLQEGWIAEVERLLDTPWQAFLMQKKLIGYDDIIKYLQHDPSDRDYEMLISVIQQKTRNYAKRQMTFGRKLVRQIQQEQAFLVMSKSGIEVCNLTLSSVDLYIKQLLKHPLLSQ